MQAHIAQNEVIELIRNGSYSGIGIETSIPIPINE